MDVYRNNLKIKFYLGTLSILLMIFCAGAVTAISSTGAPDTFAPALPVRR